MGSNEGWELIKNKKGIRVYTRDVKGSSLHAFKGMTQLESCQSMLNRFFADTDAYPDWIGLVTFSKKIKIVENPFDGYFYAVITPPWPVKKRDTVAHHTIVQEPETLITTFKMIGISDFCPISKKHVRVPLFYSMFKTTPLENGKVEISFEVLGDCGGLIPNWVVNYGLKFVPYISLKKIKSFLPKIHEKYKGVSYECIKEPSSNLHSPLMSILD